MKKFLKVFLVFIFSVTSFTVFAQRDIKISLDGAYVKSDVAPYIKNSRTLVPIRFVSEALEYEVSWNDSTREVTIKNEDKKIVLTIDSTNANINDKNIALDVAPEIKNNRTFVPIRFVAENLGVNVSWDSKDYVVKLERPSSLINKNLSKEEKVYLSNVSSLSSKLQNNMDTLKKYYFEDASKYTKNELLNKYDEIKLNIDDLTSQISALNAPEKFSLSNKFLKEASEFTKLMVSEYNRALIDGNNDSAKTLVNLQTKLAIKLTELRNAMDAEIKGIEYKTDADIDKYNDNLLENETIKNLLNKI